MGGGKKSLLATVALVAAGCTADDGRLNVRTIADPMTAASKRGSPMLTEARAMLALNSVGLALEAYRKALRQQPDSIEALAGIAECYDRMGRYDLSRVNYEAALAIAPNNPALLNTFAVSLQRQGRTAEAIALRSEAAEAEAADIAVAVRMAQADIAPVAVAVAPIVQPKSSVEIPAPPPPAAVAERIAPAIPAPVAAVQSRQAEVIHTEVVGNTEWTIEVPKTAPVATARVGVDLQPVQPVESAPEKAAAPIPPQKPIVAEPVAVAKASPQAPPPAAPPSKVPTAGAVAVAQPRLERLSMGEVALLTRDAPAWRTEVVAQTRQSVTARFVPLKTATAGEQRTATARFVPLKTAMAANRPNIRLLNAARHQGLAARTRMALLDRGWRKIGIGDAAQVRARSIVLYPANRQALGKRLAAQFGFVSAVNSRSDEVLVLLGRDAPSLTFRRARG